MAQVIGDQAEIRGCRLATPMPPYPCHVAGWVLAPTSTTLMPDFRQVADEKYFTDLPGGVLESVGRLFKRSVKMYVYPTRDPVTGEIQSLERAPVPSPWHHLRALLLEIDRVESIRGYDES